MLTAEQHTPSEAKLFEDVPEARRRNMRAIRSLDTAPERIVRSALHRLGYRFRKNWRALPGRPDIVFTAKRKVIFIHGCFWHSHKDCPASKIPKVNAAYWTAKLSRTRERDERISMQLADLGWEVLTVWECELKEPRGVDDRLTLFLGMPRSKQAATTGA